MANEAAPDEVGSNDGLGPWVAAMLERPQPLPCFVCRQIGESQWEQLRADSGALMRFETLSEAQRAADQANAKAE